MRIIRFNVIAVMAGFLVGMMAGAAVINLVCGVHIDNAELEIEKLNTKLADQAEQITALEKTLAQRQKLEIAH